MVLTTHYWHPHIGGIETVAAHHCCELASRGWTVDVHTSLVPDTSPKTEQGQGYSVRRHRAANPLERRLGVPVPLPYPGTAGDIDLAVEHADVVVAHGHVYPISVTAMRSARRHRRPFVLVQHNPWIDYPAPLAGVEWAADRLIGRRILHAADVVICVSRFTESYVRKLAPKSRTVVLQNGVDTNVFVPTDVSVEPSREFVCIRRLVQRNGVDVLIDAWELADLDDWSLVVIGDGPESEKLHRRARHFTNVSFAGFLPRAEMASRLRQSYACIVPTRSGEGFGLAAAEAQACGIPVIAAAQGALPEIVTHEQDGLQFVPGDPADLARQLRRLASDPELRGQLSLRARESDWSWDRVGAQLSGLLYDVVEQHQR